MPGWNAVERDDDLRLRLRRRYGDAVDGWLAELPVVLDHLGARWQVSFESVVSRGSMSVVIRCRTADGRSAVLKITPDRRRIATEAAALARWQTAHVPGVLAADESVGALLLEAIEPGTPLAESAAYPATESVAGLITSLHADVAGRPAVRPVAQHVTYLFDASSKLYEWKPELVELIPPALYERARDLAMRLAEDAPVTVLLHGDLTPVNVLDGGEERGLVAIDPAPCLGDPAFDAVDLVLWLAGDVETVVSRVERLAPAIGVDPGRLFAWCSAFAGMNALEIAEREGSTRGELDPLLALAAQA